MNPLRPKRGRGPLGKNWTLQMSPDKKVTSKTGRIKSRQEKDRGKMRPVKGGKKMAQAKKIPVQGLPGREIGTNVKISEKRGPSPGSLVEQ